MKKNQSSLGVNCELIKDNIDILSFCEQHYNCAFIPGSNGWYNTNCLMPEHNDTNPSFGVNVNENTFHCFGCGAKGSIIDLVIAAEDMTLSQAVTFLLDYIDIQPDIASTSFYNIKKILRAKKQRLDREALILAKINVLKNKYLSIDSPDDYYKKICKLFKSYSSENDSDFVKSIYGG